MRSNTQLGIRIAVSSGIREIHGIEELEHAIRGGHYSNVKLGRGAVKTKLIRISIGASTLDSGVYYPRLSARGGMPSDAVTLGYFAAVPGEGFLQGQKFESSSAVIMRPGDSLDAVAPAGLHWFALTVPQESLGQKLEALGHDPARFLPPASGLLPPNGRTTGIGRLLAQVYRRGLRPGPIASDDDLEEQLILAFADSMQAEAKSGRPPGMQSPPDRAACGGLDASPLEATAIGCCPVPVLRVQPPLSRIRLREYFRPGSL